jgi:hypothetical protein
MAHERSREVIALSLYPEMRVQTHVQQTLPHEVRTMYARLCLPCKKASGLAKERCADLQSCPTAFLHCTSLTLAELPQLVPPCEAVFHAPFGHVASRWDSAC